MCMLQGAYNFLLVTHSSLSNSWRRAKLSQPWLLKTPNFILCITCFLKLWTTSFFCHLSFQVLRVLGFLFLDILGFLLEGKSEQTFYLLRWGKNRRNKASRCCLWLGFFFLAGDIWEYQDESRQHFLPAVYSCLDRWPEAGCGGIGDAWVYRALVTLELRALLSI